MPPSTVAARRPRSLPAPPVLRPAVAASPGGWLGLAWLLWLLGLAAILVVAPWEAIAFHLIWVSFGLMIWHARRRQAAGAASARVSAENSRLLAAQARFLQDASEPVAADRERLRLALDALLENAVQHTGPGDLIRLSVLRCPHSPAGSLVVQDSGSGISPAEAAHIFERFRTGSAPGRHAGTGLELALVLAVARGPGGEIRVESTPGHGSRLELRLPEHPAPSPADRSADPASPADGAGEPCGRGRAG